MSKFLILPEREINQEHWDRANEIFDTWATREDAEWDDLLAMVAEALQIVSNQTIQITPEEDSNPEVEVRVL